jgi:hypothetical protein
LIAAVRKALYLPFLLPLFSGLLYANRNYLRHLLFWKKEK